jgi:hypothetical protein
LFGNAQFVSKMNCHLDRSVAQWRDLRFLPINFVAEPENRTSRRVGRKLDGNLTREGMVRG